ncbi:PGF-CTERM-anchored ABC transporter substrate-binding protein [Halorussus halophilus]|uniref:PGF-CTERM-anchored ABC transporter substrate-binding protein n=1 Tax=Halorussus halophilus TaxID=2650975 RepID=UPI0013018E05|nr:PGF-CTERM-anchored ABC transporter substrate-binding protein [Halorussus halophilus]
MNQRFAALFAALLLVGSVVGPVGSATATMGPTDATDATGGVSQADCSFPFTASDATGTEVTVEEKPERVVTLSPSAAQTMWEIGGKSQVVGVSKFSAYLDGADSRANVSGAGRTAVVVEKVVAEDPDLVLAPNVITNETVTKLREAGLTVYRFGPATSVEDIYAKTELTGELTGNCEGAAETVSWMKDRVETVRQAVEGEDSPSVLVSQGGGWTAGEGTFINNLVELAGGENVAVTANVSGYAKLSDEVVVEQNPQYIVQLGQFGAYPKTAAYNNTAAVKNGNVFTVNGNFVSQPAPQVVYPLTKMAKTFHPEAYAEANASVETTTQGTETSAMETTSDSGTTEEAMADDTATTTTGESSSGTVPGFGASAALVAFATVALLASRR